MLRIYLFILLPASQKFLFHLVKKFHRSMEIKISNERLNNFNSQIKLEKFKKFLFIPISRFSRKIRTSIVFIYLFILLAASSIL